MEKQIRVLHVLGRLEIGGAESRIMDLYRQMDRSRIQFDFLTHTNQKGYYEDEIESMGGKIYHLPRFRLYNYGTYRSEVKKFFREHHAFHVVQGHITSTASIYLPIAKKYGVPITIAHARSAGVDKGIKGFATKILRKNLNRKADYLFACSKIAGEAVFGKEAVSSGKVEIIPNAIETARFIYQKEKRVQMRERLGLGSNFTIGHVGSFRHAKNHEFLLKIFSQLDGDCELLLVGSGELQETMENLAENMKIKDRVHFLGNHENVEDYYQAMDFFVFPSRYEGLPGSVVEAQTMGLPCLISDTITEEVVFTELVKQMSIDDAPEKWADHIRRNVSSRRESMQEEAIAKGFDVTCQAEKLMEFYVSGKGMV